MKNYRIYTIKCKPTLLQLDDRVWFDINGKEFEYTVQNSYLSKTGGDNSAVFDELGMDFDERMEFAGDAFGYGTNGGNWPYSSKEDFAAQTRLVNALYDKIEGRKKSVYPEGLEPTVKYIPKGIINTCSTSIDGPSIRQDATGLPFLGMGAQWTDHMHPPMHPPTNFRCLTPTMTQTDFEKIKEQLLSSTNKSSTNLKQTQNGRTIAVSKITPTVIRGEERTGHSVRGKESRTSIRSGYLGYSEIIG